MRSRSLALGASVVTFLLVCVVAATPGSPFTPVLPAAAGSSGPFRWLAERAGLDGLGPNALAAVGVVAVASAAVAFVLVLREAWLGRISPRTVLVLAIAYHVALLFLPLLFSRDVYSYSAYGRIAATYHANPYLATPADFPADAIADFVGPKWFDTPAVYGPLWTQVSALVVRVVGSVSAQVDAFRLIATAASLATLGVVAHTVRRARPGREAFALAIIGLNPVVLFQSAASGHNDLLVALAVAVALAFVLSGRDLVATAALVLGTLVKVTAAVPLLLLWVVIAARRGRGDRARALVPHVGLAVVAWLLAAAPFLNASDPTLGLVELAGHEGWLAPSRFFRRLFDGVSGDTLGMRPSRGDPDRAGRGPGAAGAHHHPPDAGGAAVPRRSGVGVGTPLPDAARPDPVALVRDVGAAAGMAVAEGPEARADRDERLARRVAVDLGTGAVRIRVRRQPARRSLRGDAGGDRPNDLAARRPVAPEPFGRVARGRDARGTHHRRRTLRPWPARRSP